MAEPLPPLVLCAYCRRSLEPSPTYLVHSNGSPPAAPQPLLHCAYRYVAEYGYEALAAWLASRPGTWRYRPAVR